MYLLDKIILTLFYLHDNIIYRTTEVIKTMAVPMAIITDEFLSSLKSFAEKKKEGGLSIKEIAKLANMGQMTLYRIIKNRRFDAYDYRIIEVAKIIGFDGNIFKKETAHA